MNALLRPSALGFLHLLARRGLAPLSGGIAAKCSVCEPARDIDQKPVEFQRLFVQGDLSSIPHGASRFHRHAGAGR